MNLTGPIQSKTNTQNEIQQYVSVSYIWSSKLMCDISI